jgi:hypothetical protein
MNIVVVQERESWDVWVSLDGHDPLKSQFGFCIGTAATRQRAVSNAVKELENAIADVSGEVRKWTL